MSRKLIVEIVGDTSGLERSFGRASRSAKGFDRSISQSARGAIVGTGAFRSLGRQVAFASSAFLGGAGLVAVVKDAVSASSRLQEETEKTSVVFGKSAAGIQQWAGTLALSFGVSTGSALQAAGVFGNMFHSLRIGEADAAAMSKRLVQLAADMASFNNASPEDTLQALQSGLAGQVRPLRQFGVFLSQDRIKAEAYADGIARAGAKLNATQKLQAAYNIILQDTKIQVGDVARNTDSLSVSQSKLRAEIENSQAIIGNALRPELAKLATSFAVWLDKQQKTGKLQKNVDKAVSITTTTVGLLNDAFTVGAHAIDGYRLAIVKLKNASNDSGFTNGLKNVLDQFTFGFGRGQSGLSGPAGTPTKPTPPLAGILPGLVGPTGVGSAARATRQVRTGLHAQFQRSQLTLAKAQVTADQADDRRILAQQAKIIQAAISQTTNLKKRTKLYQQLGQIEDQIRSIDKTAADKRTAAQQKIIDARKKALEKERQQARKELAAIKAREQTLKDQIKAIQGRFRDAVSTARQGIGDLFAGPVLNPSDDARRRTLGLGSTLSSDPRRLTADLRAQTAQFSAFQKDINTLIKRGAPNELIRELRAQGLSAAPEVRALATAGKGTLSQFFKAFGTREQLAIRTAKTVMRSQLVTLNADRVKLGDLKQQDIIIHHTVELDGQKIASNTTKHQARAQRRTAAQRTGRVAGLGPVVG